MSSLSRCSGSSCGDGSCPDGANSANACQTDDLEDEEVEVTKFSVGVATSTLDEVTQRSCLCRICGENFSSRAALVLHLHDKHSTGDRFYKCGSCFKSFPSSQQLTQHMLVHTNVRRYQCQFCDKAFKQLSHVQQHERIHTGELPYHCPISSCDRSFRQLSSMKQHLKGHGSSVSPVSVSPASSSPSPDPGFSAAASPNRTNERVKAPAYSPNAATSPKTHITRDTGHGSSMCVQLTDARSSESENSVESSHVNNEEPVQVKKWRETTSCVTPLYQRSLIDLSSKLVEIKRRQRRLRLRATVLQ